MVAPDYEMLHAGPSTAGTSAAKGHAICIKHVRRARKLAAGLSAQAASRQGGCAHHQLCIRQAGHVGQLQCTLLGEQESFKPLIVSRISSYGNVRTALMLQWLDNHSKTWSGMRKVNLGTHRWHLVIPLSSHPPYQCACRPGRERLLEIMVAVYGIEIMVAVCGM